MQIPQVAEQIARTKFSLFLQSLRQKDKKADR